MKRWLFNGLATVSLALCVATVVLWVRSFVAYDGIGWGPYSVTSRLVSLRGRIMFIHMAPDYVRPNSPRITSAGTFAADSPNGLDLRREADFHSPKWWQRWGVYVARDANVYVGTRTVVCLGYPVLILLLSAAPVRWTVRGLRQKKITGNHRCPTCGYDLRASPERCPECGTMTPASADQAALGAGNGK